jgi:hypothetical protein
MNPAFYTSVLFSLLFLYCFLSVKPKPKTKKPPQAAGRFSKTSVGEINSASAELPQGFPGEQKKFQTVELLFHNRDKG